LREARAVRTGGMAGQAVEGRPSRVWRVCQRE
jgi:hypothetical protein